MPILSTQNTAPFQIRYKLLHCNIYNYNKLLPYSIAKIFCGCSYRLLVSCRAGLALTDFGMLLRSFQFAGQFGMINGKLNQYGYIKVRMDICFMG